MKHEVLKHLLLAAGFILMCHPMYGRHLTAVEALGTYQESTSMKKPSSGAQYTLAYSEMIPGTDTEGVYVFSRSDHPGFLMLSADDSKGSLLLGFSESSDFDADAMPDAFRMMLRQYAYNTGNVQVSENMHRSPVQTGDVGPICKTKWGQDYPFNEQCPLLGDRRAKTGCLATAIAQVMKVYEWPVRGDGTSAYNYIYGGRTYSRSFDFGSRTFDWDNMADDYSGSSTNTQQRAVSTLMLGCGAASNTVYTESGSGAYLFSGALGLIRNLGYDKGMRYIESGWMDYPEWVSMIHEEIAEGRPVIMSGLNERNEAHSFICDGFTVCGYRYLYHFNWGWCGKCDGYFSLDDLNPLAQDGEEDSSGSFNFHLEALLGIRPATEDSETVPALFVDNFRTAKESYERKKGRLVRFLGPLYSCALGDVEYNIALKFSDAEGDTYFELGRLILSPKYGFNYFEVESLAFPEGTYNVSFVYSTGQTEWKEAYSDISAGRRPLLFTVTENRITVSRGASGENEVLNAELVSVVPEGVEPDSTDPDGETEIFAGEIYDFLWRLTATGTFDKPMRCCLLSGDKRIVGMSAPKTVSCTGVLSATETYTLAIDPVLEEGMYFVGLYEEGADNSLTPIENRSVLHVRQDRDRSGVVVSVEFAGSESLGQDMEDYAVLQEDAQDIKVTLRCNMSPWTDKITLAFGTTSGENVSESEPLDVDFSDVGETSTLTFLGPWENITPDTIYEMHVRSASGTLKSRTYYFMVNSDNYLSEVFADSAAEFYDLKGLKTVHPKKGVYILRSGTRTEKVHLK